MYDLKMKRSSVQPLTTLSFDDTDQQSCVRSMRVILFFFTVLLLLSVFVIIILASYGIYHGVKHDLTDRMDFLALSIVLLIIGFIGLTVAIIGLGTIHTNSKGVLVMYISMLVIASLLMLSYLIGIISGVIAEDSIYMRSEGDMLKYIETYNEFDVSLKVTKDWDSTQQWFECCGIANYRDWVSHGMKIPKSCCKRLQKDTCDITMAFDIYSEEDDGCHRKINKYMKDKFKILASALVIFIFSAIMILIFENNIYSQSVENQY